MQNIIATLKSYDKTERILLAAIIVVALATGVFLVVHSLGGDPEYKDKMMEANQYLEDLEYDKAEAAYLEAIRIAPKKPEPYLQVADIRLYRGDCPGAIKILRKGQKCTGRNDLFKKRIAAAEAQEKEKEQENWNGAYREVLKKYEDEIRDYLYSEYDDSGEDKSSVALCDLNNDGVPELLFFVRDDEMGSTNELMIYTFADQKAKKLDYEWSDAMNGLNPMTQKKDDPYHDVQVAGGTVYVIYTEKNSNCFAIYSSIIDEDIDVDMNRYEMTKDNKIQLIERFGYHYAFLHYDGDTFLYSTNDVDYDETELYHDGKEVTTEEFLTAFEKSRDAMDQVIFCSPDGYRGDDEEIWEKAEDADVLCMTYDEMMEELADEEGEEDTADDEEGDMFSELSKHSFVFASGVGAWETTLKINPNGSFSGEYRDSDMGGTEDGVYPNGTRYQCDFNGKFGSITKTGDNEYQLTLDGDIKLDHTPEDDTEEDGVHVIYAEPYGLENLSDGDTLTVLTPGYSFDDFDEEDMFWVTAHTAENPAPTQAKRHYLYNEDAGYVFVSEE